MSHPTFSSRRSFLQWTGVAGLLGGGMAAGLGAALSKNALAEEASAGPGGKFPFQLGMASYTFRKFDVAKTIEMTSRLGLKYISLKSFHLPLNSSPEKCAEVAAEFRQAGITVYSGGVINLKKKGEIEQAFEYAKAAGMKIIVAAPVAEMLPLINEKVKEYDISVAIHNHGPTDKNYPTPESVYEAIKNLDKRMGLCVDIGHTVRVGVNLVDAVRKYADRILDIHMKDVDLASAKGKTTIAGRGVIDFPPFIRLLREINYQGIASFEYEADADDPLPGVAESIGYVRGVMSAC